MTRHFLFVDLTLTHLISLEEIIAIVTESALLGCFLAGSKGTVWRKHIIFTRCPSEGHTHLCVSCKVSGPWSNQGGGLRSCICLEFFSDHFPVPAPDDNKPKLFKYQNGFSSYQMKILSLVTHTPAPSVWVTCSNFSLVTSQMIWVQDKWKQGTEQLSISMNLEPLKRFEVTQLLFLFLIVFSETPKTP